MMKYIFILVVAAVYVQCSSRLRDMILDEIIDRYEEKKEPIVKTSVEAWADPRFCTDAGLQCYECSECHDNLQYGHCIKGAATARCLCNWGWTGQNAERVPNYLGGTSRFGINRIRADDCKTACHYEPNRWNSACAGSGPVKTTSSPKCDVDDCRASIPGICINDECTCHRPYCAATGFAKECVNNECKCHEPTCAATHRTCVNNECKCHQATCEATDFAKICVNNECKCHDPTCASVKHGTCVNNKCICHQTKCAATGYAKRCESNECKCYEPTCSLKHGTCVNNKCICHQTKCAATGYAKRCTSNECKCDQPTCSLKHGTCVNNECKCHQTTCAATGYAKKCTNNECKCDQTTCALKHGTCVNNECKCHQATCAAAGGECDAGVCKKRCCENLRTGIPLFSGSNFNSYCKERCHFQELNAPCPTPPSPSPICNPRCKVTGGLPDEATGYCQCCKDFTGPSAFYKGGKLYADYCDVYCPHEKKGGASNMLCVNQDYVLRARDIQTT